MKSTALPRYERPACENCNGMAPEVMVPVDSGAKAMCWVCAHEHCEHELPLGDLPRGCACAREEIFPADVIRHREMAGSRLPMSFYTAPASTLPEPKRRKA